MKTAIVCFLCEKVIRFSESYQVKITDFITSPNNAGVFNPVSNKVRICRTCTKKAGYKVKQNKPKK